MPWFVRPRPQPSNERTILGRNRESSTAQTRLAIPRALSEALDFVLNLDAPGIVPEFASLRLMGNSFSGFTDRRCEQVRKTQ